MIENDFSRHLTNVDVFGYYKSKESVGNFADLAINDKGEIYREKTKNKAAYFAITLFTFGIVQRYRNQIQERALQVQKTLKISVDFLTNMTSDDLSKLNPEQRDLHETALKTFNATIFESRTRVLPPPFLARFFYWVLGANNVTFKNPVAIDRAPINTEFRDGLAFDSVIDSRRNYDLNLVTPVILARTLNISSAVTVNRYYEDLKTRLEDSAEKEVEADRERTSNQTNMNTLLEEVIRQPVLSQKLSQNQAFNLLKELAQLTEDLKQKKEFVNISNAIFKIYTAKVKEKLISPTNKLMTESYKLQLDYQAVMLAVKIYDLQEAIIGALKKANSAFPEITKEAENDKVLSTFIHELSVG